MRALLVCFSLMLFAATAAHAQMDSVEVIPISSLTRSPKGLLPFDRVFYISIPKTKELELVDFRIEKTVRYPKIKCDSGSKGRGKTRAGDVSKERAYDKNNAKTVKSSKRKRGSNISTKYDTATYDVSEGRAYNNNEVNRIEATYGRYNYEIRKDSLKGHCIIYHEKTIGKFNFKSKELTTLLNERKNNVIQRDNYVLVKIFPLNPNHRYSFNYTFGSKNGDIEKQIGGVLKFNQPVTKESGPPNVDNVDKGEFADALESVRKIIDYKTILDIRDQFEYKLRLANLDSAKRQSASDSISTILEAAKTRLPDSASVENLKSQAEKALKLNKGQPNFASQKAYMQFEEAKSALETAKNEYEATVQKADSVKKALDDAKDALSKLKADSLTKTYFLTSAGSEFEKGFGCTTGTCPDSIQIYLALGKTERAIKVLIHYDATVNAPKGKKSLTDTVATIRWKLFQADEVKTEPVLDSLLECYPKLYEYLMQCDPCLEHATRSTRFFADSIGDSISSTIPSSAKGRSKAILQGLLPINYTNASAPLELSNVDGRKANLIQTAEFLEALEMVDELNTSTHCSTQVVLQDIYKRISLINDHQTAKANLLKAIYKYTIDNFKVMDSYASTSALGYSNGESTLRTKGKFNVRPDFGVAYFNNFNGSERGFYHGFVPFFGVRFNFRPLDPDMAFRFIRFKTFWHRSSINISYSPISMANGTTRFDLYSNMNFLVGYGFRLSNAINLNAGAIFFNRKSTNALSNEKQLTALPYIGVTVDFEILDVIKDFIAIFKK